MITRVAADRLESFHACGERAHAGHDQAVGLQGLPVVGGEGGVEAEIGERTHHGTHVAETVIENHRWKSWAFSYLVPFVVLCRESSCVA